MAERRCSTCSHNQSVPDDATAWRCESCQTLNSLTGRPKRGIGADLPPAGAAIVAGVVVAVGTLFIGNAMGKSVGDPGLMSSKPWLPWVLGIVVGGIVLAVSKARQRGR